MNRVRPAYLLVFAVILLLAAAVAWSQEANVAGGQPIDLRATEEIIEYTVVPGDTLWSLAQKYYNDPWDWPLIWEMNTDLVSDPHWIYPGQVLKIKLSKTEAVYGEVPVAGRPMRRATTPDLFEAPAMHVYDMTFSYDTRINRIDLISEEDLEGSGEIVHNIDGQVMLRDVNEAYFTLHSGMQVKPGDIFTVYRVEKKIEHPRRRHINAYLVNLLAEIEVLESHTLQNGKVIYSGRILNPSAEVTIGDHLMIMDRSPVKIKLNMAHVEMNGTIICGPAEGDMALHVDTIAFIDLGLKQGVEVGNSFSVWRRSDDEENFPPYKIGNIVVLRTGERFSTVLITYATREIYVGDNIISDVQ